MISLVDVNRFRRAVSFNGNGCKWDENGNEVKRTKCTKSFRKRILGSMRRKKAGSLDEASTSTSSSSSSINLGIEETSPPQILTAISSSVCVAPGGNTSSHFVCLRRLRRPSIRLLEMSLYRKETGNRRRGEDDRVHISEGVKAKIARSRERLIRDHPEKENQKTITFGEVVEIPKAKNGKNPVMQKLQMLSRSLSAKFNKDDESGLQKKFNSLMFKDKEEKKKKQTISSDTLLNERNAVSFTPSSSIRSPGSFSSNSSNDKKEGAEDVPRNTAKKKKYFADRNKSIFKKILHPNYQERNAQYKKFFGHLVAEDDLFLISFSCAYQREILCQGRMYISQRHICFHANILGWESRLAIPIDQVANITKAKAALIFPNSLQLETIKGEKYFFASFVNREKSAEALNLVLKSVQENSPVTPEMMWEKMNTDRNTANGKALRNGHEPQTPSPGSKASSPLDATPSPSLHHNSPDFPPITEASTMSHVSSLEDIVDANCPCDTHFGRLLLDAVFPVSPEELYRMIFHEQQWERKFNQVLRNTGYERSAWAKDKDGIEGRICTYTMELNHAMAPKSCVVTEKHTIYHIDESGEVVVVHKETQNSGVPYADHFTVNCNYCMTRVGRNQVRLRVHGGLNYKKTIWGVIKSYIEKSTYQGLDHHYAALETTVRGECALRRSVYDEENESIASSIEDPAPEASTPPVVKKKHVEHQRMEPTPVPVAPVPAVPDYSPYIRIIIGLLAGLLFLNLLLLFRSGGGGADLTPLREDLAVLINRFSAGKGESTGHDEVLQTLLSKVEQLSADLHRLKQAKNEL